jgi:hypothetical protein
MIDLREIIAVQTDLVVRWHKEPIDQPFEGFMAVVCRQHSFNFLLWHQEDIARSPDASDEQIAEVKRAIDRYNQQRNDWIEKIDDYIAEMLQHHNVVVRKDATLNTETPGSAVDRLSILSLRIFHLDEQLQRDDADRTHQQSVMKKLAICRLQQDELSFSLQNLVNDIFSGRRKHRTYRQFKMYNDPTLNPYLYNSPARQAG